MRASTLSSVGLVFLAAFVAAAGCGDDEPPKKEDISDEYIECGAMRCNHVKLPQGYDPIPACCPEQGGCGLNGAQFEMYGAHFTDPCQPLDQPGALDTECLDSTPIPTDLGLDLIFKGCCTAAGRCGYWLDTALNIVDLDLGCVDAEPFMEAGVPPSCTPGPGGGGGAGGGGP